MPGKRSTVLLPPPSCPPSAGKKGEGDGIVSSSLPAANGGPSAGFAEQHHAAAMFHPREWLRGATFSHKSTIAIGRENRHTPKCGSATTITRAAGFSLREL